MSSTVAVDPALLKDGTYIPRNRPEQISFLGWLVSRIEGLPSEIDYHMRLNHFLENGGTKPARNFKLQTFAATEGIDKLIQREEVGEGTSQALKFKIHQLRILYRDEQHRLKLVIDTKQSYANTGTGQGGGATEATVEDGEQRQE